MNFRKYQHVEKLGNLEVEGITLGQCYILPKLDGSNASLWLNDKDQICGGSRNRELTLDNDNQGFLNYVMSNDYLSKINKFFNHYPNLKLFGEWLVPHSLKTYLDNAWRKFYIFDVVEENGEDIRYLTYDEYKPVLDKFNLDYVPCLRIITNPDYESLVKCLNENNYLIKDGEGVGEGVVIKNYQFKNKFGRTIWAKLITSEFKEKHAKEMGSPKNEIKMVEQDIVDNFCTEALINKVYAKIENENNGWSAKFIPQFLNTVYYDLIKEECWEFIKKFKQPTINFKTLNFLVINKIKEIKKELF